MTKKEWIYDMMNGFLAGDALMLPKEDIVITDEFQEGMYCYKQYEQVYHAKISIEDRLMMDEDVDAETIIDEMNDIIRYLAMEMYDCGKNGDESVPVLQEYVKGSYCHTHYNQVLEAKYRLEHRLGVTDDLDVDTMIRCMFNILKYLIIKIYDYGRSASKRGKSCQ